MSACQQRAGKAWLPTTSTHRQPCWPAAFSSKSTSPLPPRPAPLPRPACPQLVDSAWAKWLQEEEGVVDDITAVIIKFNPC